MTKELFFDLLCDKYFRIPKLRGVEKRFVDFIKQNGAHCHLPGAEIERVDNQELLRTLLVMLWSHQIPSFSITISA